MGTWGADGPWILLLTSMLAKLCSLPLRVTSHGCPDTPLACLHSCRRKKDHGRAEALLIAAWSLGCRAQAVAVAESEDAAGEEDEVLL